MKVRTEKEATGKYSVYTVGEYPRRVGYIVGTCGVFCAEKGPVNIGYFKTLQAAKAAIAREAQQ